MNGAGCHTGSVLGRCVDILVNNAGVGHGRGVVSCAAISALRSGWVAPYRFMMITAWRAWRADVRRQRRQFLIAFWNEMRVVWPIFSALLAWQILVGTVIGWIEGWPWGNALYFTFVTGLTIGYGDLVPHSLVTRLLTVVIGLTGVVMIGLVAAIGVQALKTAVPPGTD